jgi:hypothetical protein
MNSDNPKCQLVYRRVVDLTDVTENMWDSNLTQGTYADPGPTNFHIEDDAPTTMLDSRKRVAEDSPDVFKRVRFLSRWEDLQESRGPLVVKIGAFGLWGLKGPGLAAYHQMSKSLVAEYTCSWNRVVEGVSWPDQCFICSVFFVGTSVKNSTPVILIYAETRELRENVIKTLQNVDWLKSNTRIMLASASGNLFLRFFERTPLGIFHNNWKAAARLVPRDKWPVDALMVSEPVIFNYPELEDVT